MRGKYVKNKTINGGSKKRPVYKIVVADSRAPRDGRFVEKIGLFKSTSPERQERKNKGRGRKSKILDK